MVSLQNWTVLQLLKMKAKKTGRSKGSAVDFKTVHFGPSRPSTSDPTSKFEPTSDLKWSFQDGPTLSVDL